MLSFSEERFCQTAGNYRIVSRKEKAGQKQGQHGYRAELLHIALLFFAVSLYPFYACRNGNHQQNKGFHSHKHQKVSVINTKIRKFRIGRRLRC